MNETAAASSRLTKTDVNVDQFAVKWFVNTTIIVIDI